MSKKILVAQNIKELKYLIKNTKDKFRVLPLNLKTQLYCISKNIEFINLSRILDNDIHKNVIVETEKILNKININIFFYNSINKELKAWLRFRIYSFLFLYYVIPKIQKQDKNEQIVVSGWDSLENLYSENNYFVSSLVKSILKNKVKVLKKKTKTKSPVIYDYEPIFNLKKSEDNYFIVNNLGYNFKRIFFWSIRSKKKLLVYSFNKLPLIKKIILKICSVKIISINKIQKRTKLYNYIILPKISYKKIRLDKVFSDQLKNLQNIFNNLNNQIKSLDKIIKFHKISLGISNIARGVDGALLEVCKRENIKTLCIPHGTLSKHFNKYDKIYKKNISSAILNEDAMFTASQSKISDTFFKVNKSKSKVLRTGNLIFNSTSSQFGKNILYAVTIKDFYNMQFFGVETFYEYIDNLNFLNNIAKKLNSKIIIKPHPTEFDSIPDLKKTFKNLYFTNEKNESLFKKVKLTISFSSTIIEDSLNSLTPVILLDRWKRYKHCDCQTNVNKFSPIYYVTDKEKLISCINKILNNAKSKFFKIHKKNLYNKNLENLFNQTIYEK